MVLKMERECINIKMGIVLLGFGKMIKNGKEDTHFMMDVFFKVSFMIMLFSKGVCYIQMVMYIKDSLNMVKEMELVDIH
jgi:hypothetical protein